FFAGNPITTALCVVGSNPCTPTTSAPADLWIYWYGTTNQMPPGIYTASYPVVGSTGCSGDCVLSINLTIVPYTVPAFNTYGGICVNCTRSSSTYMDLDTADFVEPAHPDPASTFSYPPVGKTYVDGNFGGIIRTLSKPPRNLNA